LVKDRFDLDKKVQICYNISVTDVSVTDIFPTEFMTRSVFMDSVNSRSEKMLPLTPAVFHIILALADKERHGYAIMQEIAANTQGKVRMGPGTLYGSIKRMIAANLIEESDERPDPDLDDARRRYYRLTELGRRVATAEAERLSELVRVAQAKRLLGGTMPGLSWDGA
jgi:DNA-binding PadR family transcriptional regulator